MRRGESSASAPIVRRTQPADRIDVKIRLLAADLDRIEAEQARGADVVDDPGR